METIYNVDYFIKKFQSLSENLWFVGEMADESGYKRCAIGHCNFGKEQEALWELFPDSEYRAVNPFSGKSIAPDINDGKDPRYQQPTPKQRILAALYDIYEKTYGRKYAETVEPKEKVIYKTVVIDSAVKTLQETLSEN